MSSSGHMTSPDARNSPLADVCLLSDKPAPGSKLGSTMPLKTPFAVAATLLDSDFLNLGHTVKNVVKKASKAAGSQFPKVQPREGSMKLPRKTTIKMAAPFNQHQSSKSMRQMLAPKTSVGQNYIHKKYLRTGKSGKLDSQSDRYI